MSTSNKFFVSSVFFFILLFFSNSVFALTPEDEVKLLKDELKHAYDIISKLEERLTVVETKIETAEHDVRQVRKETDKERESANKLYNSIQSITKGFEYHGYLRSGFGVNDKGGHQIAFEAPGADAKYRLGNETETYGELLLVKDFGSLEPDDPFFRTDVRLAFKTFEYTNYDNVNDQFTIREAFGEMGNFDWAPGVSFWAGERFYRRHDIHIIDYYFFNMSGYGGGVEGIQLGEFSKLAVAYFGGSADDMASPKIGDISKNSLDIRFYDIPMPIGKGMIWFNPSIIKGSDYLNSSGNDEEYKDAYGWAVGFLHTLEDPFGYKGYNKLSVQYGIGSSESFDPNVIDPDNNLQDRKRFRVTESGVIQVSEKFAFMYDTVFQIYDNGAQHNSVEQWFSIGARPIYFFNKNLAFAVEAGLDHVKSDPRHFDDMLFKITFAPEVRIDNKFMGRPVLRAYVTCATWGDDFKGRIGGRPYEDDTFGLSAGVQVESWW